MRSSSMTRILTIVNTRRSERSREKQAARHCDRAYHGARMLRRKSRERVEAVSGRQAQERIYEGRGFEVL